MPKIDVRLFRVLLTGLLAGVLGVAIAGADSVVVSQDGCAKLEIVVSPHASDAVRQSSADLAAVLKQITGADFAIKEGDGQEGLVVGTIKDFPAVADASKFSPGDPMRREEYTLLTYGKRLALIGASDSGVDHAVWDLLHRLGYRQYFPAKEWEIIPHLPSVTLDLNAFEHPDYIVRNIWFGFGSWPENLKAYLQWQRKNRMSFDGFTLRSGHAYDDIVARFKAEFTSTPGLMSTVEGKPTNKINIGNAQARKLALQAKIDEASALLQKGKPVDSVSMDPSDGGGWGESPGELEIGTPSDRVVFLANAVCEKLNEQFGPTYVGIYAYNQHSSAPLKVRVDPRVIVSFATSFLKGETTLEQNIEAWRKMGAELIGIREYYSVYAWDSDMPGYSKASQLDKLATSIPDFFAKGARFMSAESSDNWGPSGLGYYLASRLLWDTKEASQAESIQQEFIKNCFPEAEKPMTAFYRDLINPKGGRKMPINQDMLGRMYRLLQEARGETTELGAMARLDSLVLYTRHLENRLSYQAASPEQKQAAFEELLRFGWRIRASGMIHSLALWRAEQSKRYRDRNKVAVPAQASWEIEEGKNPWKDSTPFSAEEIGRMVEEGVKNNPLCGFEPVAYSKDLVPATGIPALRRQEDTKPVDILLRGETPIYTYATGETELSIPVTAGLVYKDVGSAKFDLLSLRDGTATIGSADEPAGDDNTPVFEQALSGTAVPPDRNAHRVDFKLSGTGSYIVRLRDRAGGTKLLWPEGKPFTLESSLSYANEQMQGYSFVFYVPKGTKSVGAFATGNGRVVDGKGKERLVLKGSPQYINIPLSEGDDGACWRFESKLGTLRLMTVPPYMAPSAGQLLLPREVVEADK